MNYQSNTSTGTLAKNPVCFGKRLPAKPVPKPADPTRMRSFIAKFTGAERRASTRTRQFKGARIIFNSADSTMDCTIRNSSGNGHRLSVKSSLNVPKRFALLNTATGEQNNCKVIWRGFEAIGVKFV